MYHDIGSITKADAENETDRLFDGKERIVAEQSAKRKRAVRIRLAYHGVMVEFAYSAEDNVPIHELEQSIDTMLHREGWTGMPQPPRQAMDQTAPKPPPLWVDPEYDHNGDPCCPVHRKPLKQGTYGSYCSSKASQGQAANDKGYCSLKFKE